MVTMGVLQSGLPTRHVSLKNGLCFNLQDCFYTISIHPKDRERFAFSVPSLNQQEPLQSYQWTVLPQSMTNSLTMCQYFEEKYYNLLE
jgi:hypothetical protein